MATVSFFPIPPLPIYEQEPASPLMVLDGAAGHLFLSLAPSPLPLLLYKRAVKPSSFPPMPKISQSLSFAIARRPRPRRSPLGRWSRARAPSEPRRA